MLHEALFLFNSGKQTADICNLLDWRIWRIPSRRREVPPTLNAPIGELFRPIGGNLRTKSMFLLNSISPTAPKVCLSPERKACKANIKDGEYDGTCRRPYSEGEMRLEAKWWELPERIQVEIKSIYFECHTRENLWVCHRPQPVVLVLILHNIFSQLNECALYILIDPIICNAPVE